MTDADSNDGWKKTLDKAASASGHEARNALNGLVVNLEVVRAMVQRAGFDAEPFMGQAVQQSEESIRLTDAAIALLKLVIASAGTDGCFAIKSEIGGGVSLDAGEQSERLAGALQPLSDRNVLSVERSGSTVILRVPEERHD